MGRLHPAGRDLTAAATQRAKVAVSAVFAVNGFCFASLASRVPAVRDTLELSASGLGLLLLTLSGGTLTALPLSGAVVHRLGAARAVLAGSLLSGVGLGLVATGLTVEQVPLVGLGLAAYGAGTSIWDVAMNVEGADVERRLGRTVMPRFHAGFSLGTVGGALAAAGVASAGAGLPVQLAVVAPAAVAVTALAVRSFRPAADGHEPDDHAPRGVTWAWREPRTLLVGLVVCSFALVEGVANDWIALALIDGHAGSEALGALGFGVFVSAMTLGRLTGGALLDRFGRVQVLRATGLVAVLGVSTVIVADPLAVVVAGAAAWGLGASLGFPVGMSAAADDSARAAARVAVVSSIGYSAFLAGPPAVGFLADAFGVLRALLVAVGAALVGATAALATRPARRPRR